MNKWIKAFCVASIVTISPLKAFAAVSIPFTVNTSEAVTVDTTGGTPRIAVDVGGNTRYATYTAGSGTSALTFTLSPTVGDVDLDGVAVSSPIDLNGGTIKDSAGNNAALTFTPPNTSGIKVDYPSLSMDFINNDYILSGTHYNTLTSFLSAAGGSFTRASTATYFDSTGTMQTASSGALRFDYDPVTHTAKGILIEESRTNLAKNSENITAWNNNTSLTITSDVVTAPNGTMTADTTNSVGSTRYTTASLTSGIKYTYSFFVKPTDTTKQIYLYVDGAGGTGYCRIVPSTGTVSNTSGIYNSAGITSIGNGWYRAYMVFTPTTTGNQAVHIYPLNADVNAWWGAQLEAGSFPTSYIPTTTAAVTRAADTLALPTGGWFSNSLGSFNTKYDITGFATTAVRQYVMGTGASSDSGLNRLNLRGWDGGATRGPEGIIGDGTANSTLYVAGAYAGPEKAALTYSASNSAFSRNGSTAIAGVAYSGSAISSLYVGSLATAANSLNGHLAIFKYYPSRIADPQLQLLTQ